MVQQITVAISKSMTQGQYRTRAHRTRAHRTQTSYCLSLGKPEFETSIQVSSQLFLRGFSTQHPS